MQLPSLTLRPSPALECARILASAPTSLSIVAALDMHWQSICHWLAAGISAGRDLECCCTAWTAAQ